VAPGIVKSISVVACAATLANIVATPIAKTVIERNIIASTYLSEEWKSAQPRRKLQLRSEATQAKRHAIANPIERG
jgi:hypothetical protein